jgi:hypothetical protein
MITAPIFHPYFFSHFRFNQATKKAESKPVSKRTRASWELITVGGKVDAVFTVSGREAETPGLIAIQLKNFQHFS